jgi:hypothetical protein
MRCALFPCQNDGAKNHKFPQEDIVVGVLRRIWRDNHSRLYYLGHNMIRPLYHWKNQG